ncbi:MAG: hypothetical protein QQN41_03805 [Nitrosopumilus sp.]
MSKYMRNLNYLLSNRVEPEKLQPENRMITIDGAISELYNNARPKIMWILREPHGKGGDSLLDYVISLSTPGSKHYLKGGSTYGVLAKVTYGVLNNLKTWGPWAHDRSMLFAELMKVAIINLNKFGGKGRVNWRKIMPNIQLCTQLTLEQLRILDPEIIICAGTTWYVDKHVLRDEKLFDCFKALRYDGTIYVSAYHTGQSTITHQEYYRRIINAIRPLV